MTKEEALKDFFKSLKISLKNSSIYFSDHPLFIKSIKEMKEKADTVLGFLSPIKIGFTPHSLVMDKKHLEKDKLYEELAEFFHIRKIKSMVVKKRITLEELSLFIIKLSLSPRDLLRDGGLSNILKREKIKYLKIEELDYSQLLKGEGEDLKDIWIYLLHEAMRKKDINRISQLVDNFEKMMESIEIKDILEDEKLWESMNDFFSYLRDHDKDKFRKCAKDFIKAILKDKNIPIEMKYDKVRVFFAGLSEDDFASALWEEIVTDEHFDSMSFNIFSNLLEKERHQEVANTLAEIVRSEKSFDRQPQVKEKLRELFFDTSSPIVSKIYRKTLSFFLKSISYESKLTFDHDHLIRNYRFVLIRLLAEEDRKSFMISTLEEISNELEKIISERDMDCLRFLFATLRKKRRELVSEPLFIRINKQISYFIEKSILNGEASTEFEYFIANMRKSSLGVNYYLEKIFTENKVTPYILQAFFSFFRNQILYFYINLDQKSSHTKFLERMIENLEMVDSPLSLEALKNIYSSGSNSMKLKSLKAMENLTIYDEEFLLPIIKKGTFPLKKESFIILMRDEAARFKALERLFSINSFFGMKNRVLHENIKIIENEDFKEKEKYLIPLSKKKFFWNKNIREYAQKILAK